MKNVILALIIVLGLVHHSNAQGESVASLAPTSWEEVPIAARAVVVSSDYLANKISVDGTSFYLLTRKEAGINAKQLSIAIRLAWPKWKELFQFNIPVVSIIDYDQMLGGGSFSPNVLGIYLGKEIPIEVANLLKILTGWEPLPTALDYVESHFGNLQAYVNYMVTHELGHLLFGYGLTKTPTASPRDEWFALGMGLVYDRIIWASISDGSSPLVDSLVYRWKTEFANRDDIEQRLVNPMIPREADKQLIWRQNYAHGKAYVYLKELRYRIREKRFDQLSQDYISRREGSIIQYDDFLSYLTEKEREKIRIMEKEFIIR